MIDINKLKKEEKLFLLEELLNSFEYIQSPSWHKNILDKRKDFKKETFTIDEIKNEFSNKNK
jgi:hypothetical protein